MSDSQNDKEETIRMSDLSKPVIETISNLGITTMKDVACMIAQQMFPESKHKTAQRRVYDVISILIAAGIIIKDKKNLSINPSYRSKIYRPNEKTAEFIEKSHQLASTLLLIRRNSKFNRPQMTTSLPSIFIGCDKSTKGKITREFSGHELKIESSKKPTFYSSIDVIDKMNFTRSDEINALMSTSEYYKIGLLYKELFTMEETKKVENSLFAAD